MASLTDRQGTVLATIRSQECPTIREIADATGLSRSTAQTAVMALVRAGLVEQGPAGFGPGVTFHPAPGEPDVTALQAENARLRDAITKAVAQREALLDIDTTPALVFGMLADLRKALEG